MALCGTSGKQMVQPIVRRELVTGSNAEWTDEVPPLMTIVVVTGTDSDLPSLPLTFGKFAFYKVASGGDEMGTTDFDSSFTLASSTDSVTITGNLELPEIV